MERLTMIKTCTLYLWPWLRSLVSNWSIVCVRILTGFIATQHQYLRQFYQTLLACRAYFPPQGDKLFHPQLLLSNPKQ